MATFPELLRQRRERAEHIANDSAAPEMAWQWPGEWRDVADMHTELQESIAGMPEPQTRLLLLAYTAGEAFERARLRAEFSPTVDVADRVTRGGQKGAARAHGPHAERRAKREAWRVRFAELRAKFPEASKKTLLDMIAADTGEKCRTLRRYIRQR